MTIATDRRMTLKEFLTYDDGTDTRYELEDGVLVEMGAEATVNINIVFFLIQFFLRTLDYQRFGNKVNIQVRSRYVTVRVPDLTIHSDESALALVGRSEACLTHEDPNPLIVIEVVSPGTESTPNYKRDYEHKPREYAGRGIPEYWRIDPKREWVQIGTLTNGAYLFTTFKGNDPIMSPTFPDLTLMAAQLLGA